MLLNSRVVETMLTEGAFECGTAGLVVLCLTSSIVVLLPVGPWGKSCATLGQETGCYCGVAQGVGSLIRCLNLTFQYAIISLSS